MGVGWDGDGRPCLPAEMRGGGAWREEGNGGQLDGTRGYIGVEWSGMARAMEGGCTLARGGLYLLSFLFYFHFHLCNVGGCAPE